MQETLALSKHAVYRFFDANGALLYIGLTVDPGARLRAHRSKPWWFDIVRIEIERHETRQAAAIAERAAIKAEEPIYNVEHTPKALGRSGRTASGNDEECGCINGWRLANSINTYPCECTRPRSRRGR